MADNKKPEMMIPVYTTLPQNIVKRVQKQADLQYLKLSDFWRRWIKEKFEEEFRND